MLRSIEALYGRKVEATDGEVGRITDFYFDDLNWVVRYVLVETGEWLKGRVVLMSPHAVGVIDSGRRPVHVNVDRKQIESSPDFDVRKPLTREYEEAYCRHYGWRHYWQGEALWGTVSTPELKAGSKLPGPAIPGPVHPDAPGESDRTHPNLSRSKAVAGYRLQASDGTEGHVCDFMIDARSWAVQRLVVRTGHRISGKEVEIPTSLVERISWDESTVFVRLTREAVGQSPAHTLNDSLAAA